jgi:hypothetical protein
MDIGNLQLGARTVVDSLLLLVVGCTVGVASMYVIEGADARAISGWGALVDVSIIIALKT